MIRSPYKYLDYYTFEDADLFFGREEKIQRMVGEILSSRLLVLFSPSGSGIQLTSSYSVVVSTQTDQVNQDQWRTR